MEKNENSLLLNIVKYVDQIILLNEQKLSLKLDSKINELQTKIGYYETRINEIVYQLYELTPEEIKIVEEASK